MLSVTTDSSPQRVRVSATGELDLDTGPILELALEEAEHTAGERVVLDLTQVTFIDSSGLKVLVEAAKRNQDAGNFGIVPSPGVLRVLDLSGLTQHLPIEPASDETPSAGVNP